jgi:Zn-dependent protease/CBS domain-containing protein
MSSSLRIARVFGIDIKVHASFTLIVLFCAFDFGRHTGLRGALFGAFFVCCAFACVVLHELGHSLVAQGFGVTVREILLLPIGGVARLEREPTKAWQELLIALAGPMVNVVIALTLGVVALLSFGPGYFPDMRAGVPHSTYAPDLRNLVGWLFYSNIVLAVFNMIPALPMDGGRVLRAGLAMLMKREQATRIAGFVGQVLAAGLVVLGVMQQGLQGTILALIGAFVFLGATQERLSAVANTALSDFNAGDVCSPHPVVLSPGDSLGAAIQLMLRSAQHHFAVVHGSSVVGALSREDALAAVRRVGPSAYVAGVMERDLEIIEASTPLDAVRTKLTELGGGRPLIVRNGEGYLGLLGLEDMNRVARIATVLRRGGLLPQRVQTQSNV